MAADTITAAPASLKAEATVQGAVRIHAALEKVANPARVNPILIGAGILAWIVFSVVATAVPNSDKLPMRDTQSIRATTTFTVIAGLVVAAVWVAIWALTAVRGRTGAWAVDRVSHGAAWLFGSGIWVLFWEISTAKTVVLAPPYFAAPQQIVDRLWDDRVILSESLGNSLLLLASGFVVGLVAGLLTGVVIGWFQAANYWVHPVLVFLGPVPSLAWVPIIFVLFPTAYSGAVFLIALGVWFPITVLTRAGILSVPRSYFDVAQTLGARSWFLVLRVSLPAALPSIFTGAFMALGVSFVSLTVAENFGVNSGLGWYLNWKKGWGDFPAVYAGIVVLVVVCGILLTLLFRARNWVLRWEKELTRW
ncbi:ABC transporter permease subunit [Dactylosporangium sp. NPDC051484]|uniref:ABC transporter permease n=1 Tax=Dactylosporangium sp. NPDC051484 TaxID=3154942 RepID=UPI00344C126C